MDKIFILKEGATKAKFEYIHWIFEVIVDFLKNQKGKPTTLIAIDSFDDVLKATSRKENILLLVVVVESKEIKALIEKVQKDYPLGVLFFYTSKYNKTKWWQGPFVPALIYEFLPI